MNQTQRRCFLIGELLKEQPRYRNMEIPDDSAEQKQLLRSLMNVRWPAPISPKFQQIQDEYLQEENVAKGIVTLADTEDFGGGLHLWQGDITRLGVEAIVNAANSGMTGCYRPCHKCIDNCIHTYAGIELRNACDEIMRRQGYEEPTGEAKITPGFNLPCRYVIHTVGPIVEGPLTPEHERMLRSCYQSCLKLADENTVGSIAFCCISTGVFMFPAERAAEIAVATVREYLQQTRSGLQVVFNVFKDCDKAIYLKVLQK